MEIAAGIKSRSNVIVCVTTGGTADVTPAQRTQPYEEKGGNDSTSVCVQCDEGSGVILFAIGNYVWSGIKKNRGQKGTESIFAQDACRILARQKNPRTRIQV